MKNSTVETGVPVSPSCSVNGSRSPLTGARKKILRPVAPHYDDKTHLRTCRKKKIIHGLLEIVCPVEECIELNMITHRLVGDAHQDDIL